jgi:hypothetical protein
LKYLVAAALLALLLLLVYSRIYPYLLSLQKFLGALKSVGTPPSSSSRTARAADHKLLRCASCGTWIPAERAIGRSPVYCSRECLEKKSREQERKIAG